MIVALLRPDSWNLPLFLHVLGATLLFGGAAAAAVAAIAATRAGEHAAVLSRVALLSLLAVVVPSWILMRVGAQWIVHKEYPDKTPGWVDVGFFVSEPGLVLLLVLVVLAWLSVRRGGRRAAVTGLAVLAPVYVIALGIAVWAMTAKP